LFLEALRDYFSARRKSITTSAHSAARVCSNRCGPSIFAILAVIARAICDVAALGDIEPHINGARNHRGNPLTGTH
jgi:hypothetical protein